MFEVALGIIVFGVAAYILLAIIIVIVDSF